MNNAEREILDLMQKKSSSNIDTLDFLLSVYGEKISDNGEDSYCYSINEDAALIGVFDGCGGSGAKKYPILADKTGAYIAARAISGAVQTWFENRFLTCNEETFRADIKEHIFRALEVCKTQSNAGSMSKLRGSIAKEFPTTAAFVCCTQKKTEIVLDCFWAGDSRIYLLDKNGLAQLSRDDIDDLDAFENISGDGVLTNVISASKSFELHYKRIITMQPLLIFTATDGCFGYIPSPMEFEFLLLDTILRSKSVAEVEEKLKSDFMKIAGDDYSLLALTYGFGSYERLQKTILPRATYLRNEVIIPLKKNKIDIRQKFWKQYREQYYRFLENNL